MLEKYDLSKMEAQPASDSAIARANIVAAAAFFMRASFLSRAHMPRSWSMSISSHLSMPIILCISMVMAQHTRSAALQS